MLCVNKLLHALYMYQQYTHTAIHITYFSPYCLISHKSNLSSSTHSSVTCGSVLCGDSGRFRFLNPLRMDVTSKNFLKKLN